MYICIEKYIYNIFVNEKLYINLDKLIEILHFLIYQKIENFSFLYYFFNILFFIYLLVLFIIFKITFINIHT